MKYRRIQRDNIVRSKIIEQIAYNFVFRISRVKDVAEDV